MSAAEALWITGLRKAKLRPTDVEVQPGDVEVETLYTAISRGTELLIFEGRVPQSECDTMRAPFQEGAFPSPVKYGYAAVGQVQAGPRSGEQVFALYPHQSRFAVPAAAAIRLPDTCPPERAILAANMETALTIFWDAQITIGDKVFVIGTGVVGALVGYLAARIPGAEVTLVDIDPDRAGLAANLGCQFARPEALDGDADVLVHASASAAGLQTALEHAGLEATIVEASWYGAGAVEAPLGAAFHRKRLKLVSSQVGRIPASQAARWDHARRLRKALELLVDPALDALISGETPFRDLASSYADILDDPATLCHRVRYTD